jgi:hypothetical protein
LIQKKSCVFFVCWLTIVSAASTGLIPFGLNRTKAQKENIEEKNQYLSIILIIIKERVLV